MAKGLLGGGWVVGGFAFWANGFRGVGCPNVVGGLPKAGTGLLAKAPAAGFAKGFGGRLLGWPNVDCSDGWPKAGCWPSAGVAGTGIAGFASGSTAPLASQISMRFGCCFSPLLMYLTAPSRSFSAVCICWLASATSPCASWIACCCLPAAASS